MQVRILGKQGNIYMYYAKKQGENLLLMTAMGSEDICHQLMSTNHRLGYGCSCALRYYVIEVCVPLCELCSGIWSHPTQNAVLRCKHFRYRHQTTSIVLALLSSITPIQFHLCSTIIQFTTLSNRIRLGFTPYFQSLNPVITIYCI